MKTELPILYTFIRCPYAMRARLALAYANIEYEHREVELSNKPRHLLQISPKGTVPVLLLPDNTVLEQSLDIMRWAMPNKDSVNYDELISTNDNSFTKHLNHYKYPNRYPEDSKGVDFYLSKCEQFLQGLEQSLTESQFLFSNDLTLADLAIFPFVRQFSIVDLSWFESSPYPKLRNWLASISAMDIFSTAMQKFAPWVENEAP